MQFNIAKLDNPQLVVTEKQNITLNYVEEFLADTDIRENSKYTYSRALKQFFLFTEGMDMSTLSNRDILAYKSV